MPEGHSIRRLADVHNRYFVGQVLEATSPQGRFAKEASVISGSTMTSTSTHGKHLFLHFGSNIVHVHLGLYGWFRFSDPDAPTTPTTRLRLSGADHVSSLSGPTTCKLIGTEEMLDITDRLGEDPLHDEPDVEKVWSKISKSKKTIAELLMDQSVIAGIGNAYRAEVLFFARQYPYTPGRDIDRTSFELMWAASVIFLRAGSRYGVINTIDVRDMTDHEIDKLSPHVQMTYVYGHAEDPCRACGTTIVSSLLAGRKLYWCPRCQV